MVTLTDHTVPGELPNSNKRPAEDALGGGEVGGEEGGQQRKKKKLRVNFNLTIDIKQEDAQCVPQGPHSLSDFSDVESLAEPIPTTPGGKPQVCLRSFCLFPNFSLL